MKIVNVSAYKFMPLDNLVQRQKALKARCLELDLRGTVLLSEEGINLNLAGQREAIDTIRQYLDEQPEYADLPYKESFSNTAPFERLKVKVKSEIITFKVDDVAPAEHTVNHLAPVELKKWLDEGRDITILDTRNDYEVEYGAFANAQVLDIENFTDLPQATEKLPAELRDKPVVMYCTGGVRCEKAGPLLEQQGFKEVYQLDGGILNYFEQCGDAHYYGECFVFDDRVTVDASLDSEF